MEPLTTTIVALPRRPLAVKADTRWGAPCLAYNVQIPIAEDALRHLVHLQHTLVAQLPVPVLVVPQRALHISVYGVLPVAWESPTKDELWRVVAPRVLRILNHHCTQTTVFRIDFDEVRVEALAVIVRARTESPFFAELRRDLGDLAEEAAVPRLHYTIVHITLGRYGEAMELRSELLQQIESSSARVSVTVDRVRLVRESVYPSLGIEPLAEVALRSANCGSSG